MKLLEDETDPVSKEHINNILASLLSCPLFPIRMSTLCVNLTIINTPPPPALFHLAALRGGMRKGPSLKMQCCLCTLTLLLQSLILCSCVSDALLLFLWCSTLAISTATSLTLCYICTEPRPTSEHSDTCPCHWSKRRKRRICKTE